jgi:hypothetical protein
MAPVVLIFSRNHGIYARGTVRNNRHMVPSQGHWMFQVRPATCVQRCVQNKENGVW